MKIKRQDHADFRNEIDEQCVPTEHFKKISPSLALPDFNGIHQDPWRRSIGELNFENIRMRGTEGPSFGSIRVHGIDLNGTMVVLKYRPWR